MSALPSISQIRVPIAWIICLVSGFGSVKLALWLTLNGMAAPFLAVLLGVLLQTVVTAGMTYWATDK